MPALHRGFLKPSVTELENPVRPRVRVLLGGHAMKNMPTELQHHSNREKSLSLTLNPVTDHAGSHVIIRETKRPSTPSVAVSTVGLVLFATLTAGFEAFGADEESDSTTSLPLDRVIVTATRTPEVESQIGSAFSQLTGEELETEQIIDLMTGLNTTPGAFALETGARGGFTTVSLRGTSPDYTLILVDGIRINTGCLAMPHRFSPMPRRSIWTRSISCAVPTALFMGLTQSAAWSLWSRTRDPELQRQCCSEKQGLMILFGQAY